MKRPVFTDKAKLRSWHATGVFATDHMGTNAAMANFGSDCLGGVLMQVMTGRAQESGVVPLKPGDGLLMAASSLASN
jgi:hypothetical protein